MGALRSRFRPGSLNRFDEIVVLHALDREHIKRIVTLALGKVTATAAGKGVTLEQDDALIDHLAEAGYLPESGAHELSGLVRSEVESRLARQMLGGAIDSGDTTNDDEAHESVEAHGG